MRAYVRACACMCVMRERERERERERGDILIIIPNVNFMLFNLDLGNLRLKVRDSVDCTPENKHTFYKPMHSASFFIAA